MVKVLLAAGAEVNKTNIHGDSSLYWASDKGHLEVVKVLLGRYRKNKTNYLGDSLLHLVSHYGQLKIVKA